ncbi:FYN-binding protein 1 isoform X2 [Myripristis murdjan]|uniref:FYN-binding protein 1 isoform X2 n=1 Tax=Myripristis murdjan TaxID=586833 RepID=UPI001175E637|nr:FYN-binding protein 1-like isoform X2 [Myripristis murdjan]
MDNKADVKAIMARFQAGGTNGTEDSSSSPLVRTKPPLHPTVSSGPPLHSKKPVLESLSGSGISTAPKPTFLKNSVSVKSAPEIRESPKTKALASMFANAQEDTNSNSKPLTVNKPQSPFKPPVSQDADHKSPKPKPPLQKPSLSSTLPDSKPAFPKPSPGVTAKPSWVKEDSTTPPKIPPSQQKPSSAIAKLRQQNEEAGGANTDSTSKPLNVPNSAVKPSSNFRTAQSIFNKEMDKPDPPDNGVKTEGATKPPLSGSTSTPPLKPPASKKPSFVRRQPGVSNSITGDDPSAPKRKPLPNSLALGPPPAKPNRPPRVNLEAFKRDAKTSDDSPASLKKPNVPSPVTPQSSNHSNPVAPAPPPQPPAPSLPPRHPAAIIQPNPDENYDDVGVMTSAPPPLPPSAGHPSQRAKEEDEDGEMYEDLDERWETADKEQEKKREKEEKEEKKRLEAERKEQKEREKKEQDARKKFKLVGPLTPIHQVKARVDHRGGKTELSLKQGDWVDIIRVQGNPEGKWLGRTQDGSYGYVKITSVDIDLESWKQQAGSLPGQQDFDPEVYDDIDSASHDNFNSGIRGPGVVLPPPPDDGEIYDDVVDPSLDVRVPPPSQFTAEGNSDKPGGAIDEDIYDDVDSQALPPPPPVSSLPTMRGKSKAEEVDPKKQKKFEKEEKEFRKKFKYEGEIQVLYQVTIIPNLTNKKWSGKDLPIKPGESLDVIVKAVDDKMICRNEEGKFGYVFTGHIVTEDADIYDDIGDDCIYDND